MGFCLPPPKKKGYLPGNALQRSPQMMKKRGGGFRALTSFTDFSASSISSGHSVKGNRLL